MEQPHRRIVAMTQYGGEGLPWVGLAPFVDRAHMVQNVGDGSLFHSSYPNIRFCAAAGVPITFKVLYNGYIANTGAQRPVGQLGIPELTRMLELDGVRRIAVVTKDPRRYRRTHLARVARVYPVHAHEQALRDLVSVGGTTVYIYDETCANERRRQLKRGNLPARTRWVWIHERVCEGCGDCGQASNCMSLHRVETEFGPKTQIHLSTCNQDESCLRGDCPSFVTLEAPEGFAKPRPPELAFEDVPEPRDKVALTGPYRIYIPGVGGTGVITVNALLAFAAWMDGLEALSYDQTGAAQKWGAVLSSLILAPRGTRLWANKVGAGQADLYLALDLIGAVAASNLDRCDPDRTVAVVNTTVLPTGEMVRDPFATVSPEVLERAVARYTRASANLYVEGRRLAEALFGDSMTTNLFVLGAAYQAGKLPLRASSIEAAIRLNGVQVEQNLQAFRYGRLWVHDPDRVRTLVEPPEPDSRTEQARWMQKLPGKQAEAYARLLGRCAHLDEESLRLLAIRVGELVDYQTCATRKPMWKLSCGWRSGSGRWWGVRVRSPTQCAGTCSSSWRTRTSTRWPGCTCGKSSGSNWPAPFRATVGCVSTFTRLPCEPWGCGGSWRWVRGSCGCSASSAPRAGCGEQPWTSSGTPGPGGKTATWWPGTGVWWSGRCRS
jgi:indolepyruvate ferredoxin oxidoreductase